MNRNNRRFLLFCANMFPNPSHLYGINSYNSWNPPAEGGDNISANLREELPSESNPTETGNSSRTNSGQERHESTLSKFSRLFKHKEEASSSQDECANINHPQWDTLTNQSGEITGHNFGVFSRENRHSLIVFDSNLGECKVPNGDFSRFMKEMSRFYQTTRGYEFTGIRSILKIDFTSDVSTTPSCPIGD